uniref:Uncharacterized protein n=1 Tax=Equus caballus TaxID=9796 RepID=A0A9L0RRD5_HORSE
RAGGSWCPSLPARVHGRQHEWAAPARPTARGRGRRRAEGAPVSVQCARLAARRAVPPAASAALRLRGTLPQQGARTSVPCAPPPRDRTSPERFPKHTLRCTRARTHTHSHTHTQSPRAAPTPARQLSVSVRPGRSSPSPSSRRVGPFPAAPGRRQGKGQPRGSRGQRAQRRSRATKGAEGWAAKRRAAPSAGSWGGRGSRQRRGSLSRPPKRAGSGGGTRRSAARLRGLIPLSRPLALLPRRLPHPGARGSLRSNTSWGDGGALTSPRPR